MNAHPLIGKHVELLDCHDLALPPSLEDIGIEPPSDLLIVRKLKLGDRPVRASFVAVAASAKNLP